jgi:hypothetical protein
MVVTLNLQIEMVVFANGNEISDLWHPIKKQRCILSERHVTFRLFSTPFPCNKSKLHVVYADPPPKTTAQRKTKFLPGSHRPGKNGNQTLTPRPARACEM